MLVYNFFEERSSRRLRQQIPDYQTNQPIQLYKFFLFNIIKENRFNLFSFRPYPPLMSPVNPTILCSPPLEHYPSNPNWISSSTSLFNSSSNANFNANE